MSRLPSWIRLSRATDQHFSAVTSQVRGHALNTVCESAKCPNRGECWNNGTATIMLLGDVCTRSCAFCAIEPGRPGAVDINEPRRAARAAAGMKLNYVVLTSVNRDDLPDGGAGIFAETIREIRKRLPTAGIEVLTPDFEGVMELVDLVLEAQPDVFNHNVETVARLQPIIRPQAAYGRSLAVLKHAASYQPAVVVKSGVMFGLGETDNEVLQTLRDLREAGVELLTLGQYLQPTRKHPPVQRYIPPEDFQVWAERAREMGFAGVASGPMIRSSYRADELLRAAREARAEASPACHHMNQIRSRATQETHAAMEQDACVIIPAYQAVATIGPLVAEVREHIADVVVVDDGSRDATAQQARQAGALVLQHGANVGKGAALQTGFEWALRAGKRLAITMDADGQHRPADIPKFLSTYHRTGIPVLLGNRTADRENMPFSRRSSNAVMSWLLNRLMHRYVPDTQCGFRLFRGDVLPFLNADSHRFAAESEVLLHLADRGFRMDSVRVNVQQAPHRSTIRPLRDTLQFLGMLRRYRRQRIRQQETPFT
jgi:lipoyl synthase